MIVDAIAGAVVAVLRPILELLPTGHLTWLPADPLGLGTFTGGEMEWAKVGDGMFPVTELLVVLSWVVSVGLPAAMAYVVANWLYRHIPQLGGFGPGSG